MEDKIAILVPTYQRGDRLKAVAKNIHANTKLPHQIYFCIERDDQESIDSVKAINETIIFNEGNRYVGAINTGYARTKESFIMCASDDLDFHKGWDIECMKVMENPEIGITGTSDSWTISKTGKHISHLFVRREYIKKFGGVEDEENTIYSNKYTHIMCDIETEQTAMKRGAFEQAKGLVEHNHWFVGTAEKDATYERCQDTADHDIEVFEQRRRKFEQYLFEALFAGKVVPVKRGLSIVLPSLNCLQYLKETISYLEEHTYNRDYELIIIDDCSDQATQNYIRELSLGRKVVRKVINTKPLYVNANWNMGIAMATQRYVAVINNDITLSKNWDVYLMAALDKADLANPYQTDEGEMTPYGKAERAGGINIRGTCFMAKKETFKRIGAIPKDLIMWFGDSWLAMKLKKSVFVPEAVVHHYGSKSTQDFDERTRLFWWIVRGDCYAYTKLTGIDTQHWIDICNLRLGLA